MTRMIKRRLIISLAAAMLAFAFVCCENPVPEPPIEEQPEEIPEEKPEEKPEETPEEQPEEKPEEDPVKLKDLKGTVEIIENMIFDTAPTFTMQISNPNEVDVETDATMTLTTDKGEAVETFTQLITVPASGTFDVELKITTELEPGFYEARCTIKKKTQKKLAFGIRPQEIVSAPDMQDDFDEFWAVAKAQLPELVEGETVTLKEIKSTNTHKVYAVEMQSIPNGLDGDPVIVRGFFVEPQDGKQHPVLMHFFGWDDRGGSVTVPSGGNGNYTEFYLSTRGQYHNNRPAAYEKTDAWIAENGEWVAKDPCKYASILKPSDEYNWFGFNFGDKNSFYYRGAFMDCVQAVNFMASRPTSDMNNLFAEGSSQGGALSYACAALSDYPFVAIAPNVAFLGDYPDYFAITGWPGNVAKNNQGSMSDEEMYAFLSYFDTKNLATRISCAVHASSGLKDTTCPPHTNFAPFNNLNTTDKVMIVDPEMGHSYPPKWETNWKKFFEERMR